MTDANFTAFCILALCLLCLYLFWVLRSRGREAALTEARAIALKVMLLAEKKYGADKGVLKMDFAAKMFYALLPLRARFILSEQGLTSFLETVYRESKDYIDDGVVNDSVR